MNKLKYIDQLLKKSKDYGFDEAEVMVLEGNDFETKIFKGEVDQYSLSTNFGVSFRGLKGDFIGYSYTEILNDDTVKMLLKEAMDNLEIIDSKDKEFLYENKDKISYKELNQYNDKLNGFSNDKKIDLLKEMERKAYEYDKRVRTVNYCLFGNGEGKLYLKNTLGLDLFDKSNVAYIYFSVGVEENDEIQNGHSIFIGNDINKINAENMVEKAVNKALDLLGAESISSKKMSVIIENREFASLLKAFTSIFNAEKVQKNMSLLKGKLDKVIASESFSLIDNPHMEDMVSSRSFDGEGVPTYKKHIIERGVLKTFFHNLKTANKADVKTTANAVRSSYKSSVGIAPSNFYVEPGSFSLESIIKKVNDGIFLVELEGLHAGLNPISGDFSLAAKGFLIEEGIKTRPVNQITVSGNFFELLKNIEMIADDLKFGFPSGTSSIGSPSILIKSLTISGD